MIKESRFVIYGYNTKNVYAKLKDHSPDADWDNINEIDHSILLLLDADFWECEGLRFDGVICIEAREIDFEDGTPICAVIDKFHITFHIEDDVCISTRDMRNIYDGVNAVPSRIFNVCVQRAGNRHLLITGELA